MSGYPQATTVPLFYLQMASNYIFFLLKSHLPKITSEDYAQAFTEAFEIAAEIEEWVVRFLPLLSGEVQKAAHSLSPSARAHY